MKLRKIRHWTIWVIPIAFLIGCGSPVFMPEQRKFQLEPEPIQELQPYLESWAVDSPDTTEAERRTVGERLNVGIGIMNWEQPNQQGGVPVVRISIEARGDWSRGYLYVHEGTEIETQVDGWELRKVDDHFYVYNYVD